MTIATVAISVLMVACDATPPATTGPTATTLPAVVPTATAEATVSPTATAIATQAATAGEWSSVTDQDAVTGAQFFDVVWSGERFIAGGVALAGGGVFVSSTDGQDWRSVPSGGSTGYPYRLAAGPSGTVAVGTIDERPASWISTDGRHWSYRAAVFPTALKDDDEVRVTDVIATSTGWLAVGRDDPLCQVACLQAPRRALVWTSTNAQKWTRVAAQASLSKAAMNAVAPIDGGYVAVGETAGHAAFWTSADGLTWTRVADDPMFGAPPGAASGATVSAVGVAALGGTVVAVGLASAATPEGGPIVMAWRSTDGRTWTQATVGGAEEGQVFSATATATRFLATGPSGATSCLGGIWSSSDGASWVCEATDAGFAGFGPYAAAGSPTLEVAVGLTEAGWDPNGPLGMPGAAWWRPAP